ncbi:MAG: glycosyltransferase family 2 protein [Hyphomonadaceae bacterium]|nr:glycosyltransferase family 2 protein [Hyphomonadaceae bacterium]
MVGNASTEEAAQQQPPANSISCIICAYNEADRISRVLRAVVGHPLISEIIVINDGSTDQTEARARAFAGVTVVTINPNGGKTQALTCGIAMAKSEYLMLLDADLVGLSKHAIDRLAKPVLSGAADTSISMRGDTLPLYRTLGIDFISGERVLPRSLFTSALDEMSCLPRWGGEVFINELIIAQKLRVSVVDWREVFHTPKGEKVGSKRAGAKQEWTMFRDMVHVLSPFGIIRQHWGLMRLAGVFFFKALNLIAPPTIRARAG